MALNSAHEPQRMEQRYYIEEKGRQLTVHIKGTRPKLEGEKAQIYIGYQGLYYNYAGCS